MSGYEQFAYLYDELMSDAPYDQWVKFVKDVLGKFSSHEGTSHLLDLACGTGELSIRFAQEGFKVTGIDLSEDMLAVAQAKAVDAGVHIPFYQQDMAALDGLDQFDVIGIFCDSLNYLKTEKDVISTFSHVFQFLKEGGIFLFDVHSLYKINDIFIGQTFAQNEEDVSYIWNSFPGEYPNSVEHDLSFFVLDEKTQKYDRFDELHFQRTFSIEHYSKWLTEAGFTVMEIGADFKHEPPQIKSERIFFVAKK
ncbi:class I SAM-dependent methyltransferase [Bacillus sp. BRMEA1]|uniref:class I SAM-dependent DNA methyltransferase n=1 Tax=Neobacillus endophyticus TaxID=2738405 RepID=UPI00156709DE|nr:class I SAM-dependent methyltransferase [Neobacillus endophyticus]NRD75904.1 class I SAM-dependent methyltransferase [Neobacillus endophyticus]